MSDPLIDDVKELLDKEKGDERILKQILRACENNEVISNYERSYVRNLAEKYLNRIPLGQSEEKPKEQDITVPEIIPIQRHQIFEVKSQKTVQSNNLKIAIGVIGVVFVLIIAVVFSISNVSDVSPPNDETLNVNLNKLSIKTDLTIYQKGDIISIGGSSNTSGKINIAIENQDGQLVWAEQVSVKSNGKFSTLAIAGGSGWDKSGIFTIKVDNGIDTKSHTFSFNVNPVENRSEIQGKSSSTNVEIKTTDTSKLEGFKDSNVSTSSTSKVEEFKDSNVSTSSLTK